MGKKIYKLPPRYEKKERTDKRRCHRKNRHKNYSCKKPKKLKKKKIVRTYTEKRFSSINLASFQVARAYNGRKNICTVQERQKLPYSSEFTDDVYMYIYKTGQILHALYRQTLTVLGVSRYSSWKISSRGQRLSRIYNVSQSYLIIMGATLFLAGTYTFPSQAFIFLFLFICHSLYFSGAEGSRQRKSADGKRSRFQHFGGRLIV